MTNTFSRRLRKLAIPLLILPLATVSVALGTLVMSANPAGATTCDGTNPPGSITTQTGGSNVSSCTITGSATVTGGSLSAAVPTSLAWSQTLSGVDEYSVVAPSLTVDDSTGSGDGWTISASATQFSGPDGTTTVTLPTGALSVNGNSSGSDQAAQDASTAPKSACGTGSSCLVPSDSLSYPVTLGSSSSPIFDSAPDSGMGDVQLTTGWWLDLPADAYATTYTSTVTITIASGP